MRRVAVTGMGVMAPNGIGVKAFAESLWNGRNGVSPISGFDASGFGSRIAGQLPEVVLPLPPAEDPEGGEDRVVRIALATATEAVTNAGLYAESLPDPTRMGVSLANAIGGTKFMTEHFPDITQEGLAPIDVASAHPRLHRAATFDIASSVIADTFGLMGPVTTLTTGCTGGNDAVGSALDTIRRGDADVMIAGAAEAPITPFVLACFDVIGALSVRNDDPAHASRPFDSDRDGFVLAEGAGLVVLEEWEHARRRGAPILAEVSGFGSTSNAFHMTDLPDDGTSLGHSLRLALQDAAVDPSEVGYVNAHGSSTPQNDVCETSAIRTILGAHADQAPVSSIKSMLGHALAAANAVELVASVLALQEQVLPPTINHVRPGPGCDLDYVANHAREVCDLRHVASLSSGFGGIHSTLVISREGTRK
ncbi:beta-ketoacyl-[acyl-carrier-protein] synthase family protein [Flexivirga sp. ID2601S]|uniref:Beta-ketoacyl-[acyl-carrier-protein] synthase family protein n=1 Tax=Flexivirga aerilata TaxID=1656889 RepID=A0A849ADH7_9MICO|nr:beta-ketoacyl-[acyl-carrier-protein] synthase family protein [Flexivirga aerilata]NNG38509.1 beta-ketoacyl-[acyl-carrier-protein] synthase family protein [Flexivirga aerilata]